MHDPLWKLLAGLTLLAFGAAAAGAADYAIVDSEARAEPRLVIVDTSLPPSVDSNLDSIIQKTTPTSAAKSFTYSLEENKLEADPALRRA